ncbi:MAG: amidophosphoribosyltransferase [Bacteroidetes bacterium RIFOXYA12_FULL_35_11]|nr:MAG: amidophosphoribosyltransferase [Bacteroidetes bacterium GWF2_35_48]OFY76040.1 MAG: amidophosphoribosyltransferase [Bacteroidetes bacterium RIFOXYA12_FULL_35_11]OFY97426.1 MAG: amidophosphoribosyltransferase [Bacteroidetes bacterium RIFOXYC12_FULL_35_7]HBX51462.1 amidophosphoribosyltransferase [Bacteroidales bacterium]
MSDQIKHECGFALIRLLRPLEYYRLRYGSWMHGLNKLYLLMEKQHNRGQDGAGAVCVKFDLEPGQKYMHRVRSNSDASIKDVFDTINKSFASVREHNPELLNDPHWSKNNLPFAGELYLGHLRYGTFGKNNIANVHPVMRENNWKTKSLALAGNFNLTNVDELFGHLVELGQHPEDYSDTVTILEKIGHFLDKENERTFRIYKEEGHSNTKISELIAQNLDITRILRESCKRWDGGYAVAGLFGHGDAFVIRDPWGIRPAFYYYDDEFFVCASERPVIQTAFNVDFDKVKELQPGHAIIARKNCRISEEKILDTQIHKPCSFERIYFSRGTDKEIYKERKMLGRLLCPQILKAIDYDIKNTVFSYIPNTASVAFYGLLEGLNEYCDKVKKEKILKLKKDEITPEKLKDIFTLSPRIDKIAVKDVKLRTFITQDTERNELVGHVYDVTYGAVKDNTDTLVVLDDSIVRGTTLRKSIVTMLDRLNPKKIVIVSSAPQIRYPDCYGIDMAKLGDFIAFEAAIKMLKESGKYNVINEVYRKCKEQESLPKEDFINYVKEIFTPFSDDEVSAKIANLLKPEKIKADLVIIYQNIENLHKAIPKHNGDWYFTGNYPTPGGNKVVNKSFINYIEGKNQRSY